MNWQPIETAPKDRRILLYYQQVHLTLIVAGHWDNDSYAVRNPKPYWSTDQSVRGKYWHRIKQPEPLGRAYTTVMDTLILIAVLLLFALAASVGRERNK